MSSECGAARACTHAKQKAWQVTPAMPLLRLLLLLIIVSPALARDPAPPPPAALQLHKWSGDINVPDPVACTVDPQGRVYVTQTTRRKVGDLDIREHTLWIPDDVSFTSVADKSAFLR